MWTICPVADTPPWADVGTDVAEADVIGYGLGDVLGLPDPEVNEHLGLGESAICFFASYVIAAFSLSSLLLPISFPCVV